MAILKNQAERDAMIAAGRIVALCHAEIAKAIGPGVRPKDLDDIVEETIRKEGGKPAFKGLYGHPAAICSSLNDVIVHGTPDRKRLEPGDIIAIDIGAIYEGFHGDSAWTYAVGEVSPEVRALLETTEASLYAGVAAAVAGARLGAIGAAVEDVVAPRGYGIVREYVGHGIGRKLHEEPQVFNYRTGDPGPVLKAGQCLAIEPMVNLGTEETREGRGPNKNLPPVLTADGKVSAHFEHTIIVTDAEPIITTRL